MKDYQDYYFRKAKKDHVVSRAYYKLQELDGKHRLLRPNARVLDLGCAPGSWMQYAAGRVGRNGKVLGVDRAALALPLTGNLQFMQADLLTLAADALTEKVGGRFDVVISDAAPNTTGQRFVDQANSLALAQRVVELALAVLNPGGHLALKIFQGPDTKPLQELCRKNFRTLKAEKPQSSKNKSPELYWVGLNRMVGSSSP